MRTDEAADALLIPASLHHHLPVEDGDMLLDVACGAGLAIELARARGAHCAGIDASARLVTGPVYEAIQNVGEDEFKAAAVEHARAQVREGLPLRAEIKVVGYLARKPEDRGDK